MCVPFVFVLFCFYLFLFFFGALLIFAYDQFFTHSPQEVRESLAVPETKSESVEEVADEDIVIAPDE